jgi:hypothetical protein
MSMARTSTQVHCRNWSGLRSQHNNCHFSISSNHPSNCVGQAKQAEILPKITSGVSSPSTQKARSIPNFPCREHSFDPAILFTFGPSCMERALAWQASIRIIRQQAGQQAAATWQGCISATLRSCGQDLGPPSSTLTRSSSSLIHVPVPLDKRQRQLNAQAQAQALRGGLARRWPWITRYHRLLYPCSYFLPVVEWLIWWFVRGYLWLYCPRPWAHPIQTSAGGWIWWGYSLPFAGSRGDDHHAAWGPIADCPGPHANG